jgi:hypothetical protein
VTAFKGPGDPPPPGPIGDGLFEPTFLVDLASRLYEEVPPRCN